MAVVALPHNAVTIVLTGHTCHERQTGTVVDSAVLTNCRRLRRSRCPGPARTCVRYDAQQDRNHGWRPGPGGQHSRVVLLVSSIEPSTGRALIDPGDFGTARLVHG